MKKQTLITVSRRELIDILSKHLGETIPDGAELKVETGEYYPANINEHHPLEIKWEG